MNDRYLYKAKRKDTGEWAEGNILASGERYFIIPMFGVSCIEGNGEEKRINLFAYEVDPSTLCQCTGVTEKNDGLIWENDICIIHSNPIDEEDGYFTVGWDNDGARFKLESNELVFDFDNIYSHECEVIGNIFDNPELLEGGEHK